MRVKDLIESLECYNPDAEVQIAIQQHYPLLSSCIGVTSNADVDNATELLGGDGSEVDNEDGDETVVYLIEGGQIGYGSRLIWEADRR